MNDLEEYILSDLGKQMSQDVDNEVMCELLAESGWHIVRLNKSLKAHDPEFKEISEWVKQHAQGRYHGYGSTWAFTEFGDSILFTLRWR